MELAKIESDLRQQSSNQDNTNELEQFQFEKITDPGSYLEQRKAKKARKADDTIFRDNKKKVCDEMIENLCKQRMNDIAKEIELNINEVIQKQNM